MHSINSLEADRFSPRSAGDYDETAPAHALNSLEAELLRDAVDSVFDAAGEDKKMTQAAEVLVYILNQYWLDDHNWELTLGCEGLAQ